MLPKTHIASRSSTTFLSLSAPAWLKTNGQHNGGGTLDKKELLLDEAFQLSLIVSTAILKNLHPYHLVNMDIQEILIPIDRLVTCDM